MTALIAPPNLTTLPLSAELWRMLSADPTGLEDIRRSPALVEECQRSARQLEVVCEPCGGDTVARALAPLVLVFGLGDQATSPQFWKVYADALGDLPRIALDRAAAEWPKIGKFFPKPAEIRELALKHALPLRQAAYRAKKALEPVEDKSVPESERIPPEAFAALMADFKRQMEERDPLLKHRMQPPRTPCAKVDETGVSAEMRAKLAERGLGPSNTPSHPPAHGEAA